MPMASYTALFDLDGTLTDPQVGITTCIAHALSSLGEPVPGIEELRDWIGAPLHETFSRHLGSDDRADEALRLYRARFSTKGLFENEPYAGISAALEAIAERADRLFVVTSKPRPFAEQIIEHFELAGFFERVYGSELDGRFARKTDLMEHVLARESIDASRAVMVGDRRYDIDAARAHRVHSIGVLWGFGDRPELQEAGADAICADVPALPAAVLAPLDRRCTKR